MRKKLPKILVTGGAGFIGSAFVRTAAENGFRVSVIDKLTYAGDLRRLAGVGNKCIFHKIDICDGKKVARVFKEEQPGIVIHFAAESHVDRSIRDAEAFVDTNICGTKTLLDNSMKYGVRRFIHISTDEVYGDIKSGRFAETSPLRPSSPYSATKAAADLLLNSYIRTYAFPGIIIRPCNNYGPWQYPEKFIPLAILRILRKEKIPVYGNGRNVREWLYVEDCAEAIFEVLEKGRLGQIYNLGSGEEKQNVEVAGIILKIMGAPSTMIEFVKDRLGHDIRYRLDSSKITSDTGWSSKIKFEAGLGLTMRWCFAHKKWLLSKWKNVAKLYR
ncbi:MAG: dTDP-glucose 4,6-dehydratase [Deltaproteobacteria bacterium]